MKELGDKLTDEDKSKLNESIEKLETVFNNKDVDQVDARITEITEVWNGISTRIYQQQESVNETQNTQNTQQTQGPQDSTENVTEDVQYEEV